MPNQRKKRAATPPSQSKRTAGTTMWGGRFTSAPHRFFSEFNDSLAFDHVLLETDIEGSIAYARALERAGVLRQRDRRRIERALREILKECQQSPVVSGSGVEDVHTFVERSLQQRIGSLALKLHTGRSRNDQVATDLRLFLLKKGAQLEARVTQLLQVIAELAERHTGLVLPGYTHLQRAQPVLFSHYLLAYGEMFLRDRARFRDAMKRTSVCPLGSGALSGTPYLIDRKALAQELGFRAVSQNSLDAVSDRDFVLDFLYGCSVLLIHLSRLSEDLVLYSSTEFGFVQMDETVSSGSSLMPQKQNPDAVELIRGKSGRVLGHLLSLLTVLKGLPMTYNKDLQEDKEGLFDCLQTSESCLRMMTLVLQTMKVVPERMRAAAQGGFVNATELADYLVARNVPFREAHEIVGRIVLYALKHKVSLEEVPLDIYSSHSAFFRQDLYQWIQLEQSMARKKEIGGTALTQVRRAIRSFHKRIGS